MLFLDFPIKHKAPRLILKNLRYNQLLLLLPGHLLIHVNDAAHKLAADHQKAV